MNPPVPEYLIVDLKPVIDEFRVKRQIQSLEHWLPLKETIASILKVPVFNDASQYLWDQLCDKIDNSNLSVTVDYDGLAVLLETIMLTVDERIRSQIGYRPIDADIYLFHQWVGSTSVLLKKEPELERTVRSFDESSVYTLPRMGYRSFV